METETEHFVDNYRKRYFNYVLHLDNGKKDIFSCFSGD